MSPGLRTRLFESSEVARLYARARPNFHSVVMTRVRELADVGKPLERGLDVGCGTGLSSRALRELAHSVVGLDPSTAMIEQAEVGGGIRFVVGSAEKPPIASESQDILSISSAFHWVDADSFFRASRRILRSEGLMVIYENGFTGMMDGNSAFKEWTRSRQLERLPTPPRHPAFSPDAPLPAGFRLVASELFQNNAQMDLALLVNYLLSQTNPIVASEEGRETLEGLRAWFRQELAPFFQGDQPATFGFAGSIHILRKA